jgi:hypothetical protein
MKLKIQSLEVEADSLEDIKALLVLALETLARLPQASPRPALAIPTPATGDRERDLRDAYKSHYGKGFSMKGKAGCPIAFLEALEAGGWKAGADDSVEGVEAPPATQADDGASIF